LFVSINSDASHPFVNASGTTNGSAPLLVPGQTVSLSLSAAVTKSPDRSIPSNDQLWVPLGALARADRGLWSLFVVVPTGAGEFEIERREVQVLAIEAELVRVDGTSVQAGDRVVSGALHRVTPGMKVEPVR